jgi:hypothetical protein
MFRKFKFEEPQYADLREIPYSTQYKLDVVGLGLDIATWRKLPLEERNVLCHLSVRSQGEREAYREFVILSVKRSGARPSFMETLQQENERSMWENPARMPTGVVEASFRAGLPLRPEDWLKFDDMERYVLFQVTKKSPGSMIEVLKEFLRSGRFKTGTAVKAVTAI